MSNKNGKKAAPALPASIAQCAIAMDSHFHHRKNIGPDELAAAAGCSPQKADAALKEMRKLRMVEVSAAGYRLNPAGRAKVRAAAQPCN